MTGTGYANVVPFQRPTAKSPNPAPVIDVDMAEPELEIAEPLEVLAAVNAEPEHIAEPVRPIEPEVVESQPLEIAEPIEVTEIETLELAEPEEIPEQIAEPGPVEIAEPVMEASLNAEPEALEIAEPENMQPEVRPLEAEISEPDEEEEIEISTEGFKDQAARLWNLTTYKDRHGKLRAKHVLRFVPNPPKRDAGIVTPDIAGKLEQRKGRGRWSSSRDEAGQLKVHAGVIAESYWRARGVRRDKGKDVQHVGGAETSS